MSRNSLTKPSNCTRTQHEHRSRSFDPSGARAEDGQGGRLLGTLASWNIMLRRTKARRLRVLESRRAEEIALDRARSGAPISPDATERQSAPTELTVAGDRKSNPARSGRESGRTS